MKSGTNETCGAVTLSHVQLEAFHEKMDGLFDTGLYYVMHVTVFVYSLILCTTAMAFTRIWFCLFTIMFSVENLEAGGIPTASWIYITKALILLGWICHVIYTICWWCQ